MTREANDPWSPESSLEPDIGHLADGYRDTDAGNARRLIEFCGDRVRYAPKWGKWLIYRGGVWQADDDGVLMAGQAQLMAGQLFRLAVQQSDSDARDRLLKWASRSEKAPAIAAMIRLARPYVRIDENDLDADPWLFNCRNGTLDLRTGELRPHNPDDLLTMQAPVSYVPDASAPLWAKCIERWQPDDDRRTFLQRAVGSAITGQPVERFFVNLGEGGNGKSKFFDTINAVVGPYYTVPDHSLLVSQRFEPHEEVKADLFRTRMVVGAETDQDAKLADAKIKDLTGGGTFTASRKFEHRFKFSQTWTMFMHTNYRPQVTDLSEGMWRRVRLVNWDVKIPDAEKDEDLLDKLTAEASGVLNWLIEGCLAWQRDGWNEPASVRTATTAWRSEEDTFGAWLDECTKRGPTYYATAADLYESYSAWCSDGTAKTKKAFGIELGKRFDSDRVRISGKRTRVWLGVELDDEEPKIDTENSSDRSAGHSDG